MPDQNDAIAIALAGRGYLYKLLRRIFGQEPDLEMLEISAGELTQEVLELFLGREGSTPYIELLDELKRAVSNDPEAVLDRLKSEYTYLMIGPNRLPAPPWESVYVTKERLIFQESTLKVRRAYLQYSFLPAEYPHVADDHIALELDFMAHLAELSHERFEEGNREVLEKVLTDQKAFLEEHLLKWVGDFAEQMQISKTHYFYPQMASLTVQVIKTDYALLGELLSIMESKEERCTVHE